MPTISEPNRDPIESYRRYLAWHRRTHPATIARRVQLLEELAETFDLETVTLVEVDNWLAAHSAAWPARNAAIDEFGVFWRWRQRPRLARPAPSAQPPEDDVDEAAVAARAAEILKRFPEVGPHMARAVARAELRLDRTFDLRGDVHEHRAARERREGREGPRGPYGPRRPEDEDDER